MSAPPFRRRTRSRYRARARRHGVQALAPPRCAPPADARRLFKRALGKAKLPAFRLYDLRHTFASLLLAASAPITYVSAQFGHVNPSTTLR